MNETERWIYFDGPEPEQLRPALDAVRDLPPATAESTVRFRRDLVVRLDATLGGETEPTATPSTAPPEAVAATARRSTVGPEVPFEPDRQLSAASPPSIPAAPPPPASPPESARQGLPLAATAPFELPQHLRAQAGHLPVFRAPADSPKPVPRTMQVPVMRDPGRLNKTAGPGDDSIARAAAAVPFGGNTLGQGVVPFPRLTLEQYASFRAELEVAREPVGAIRLRYHIVSPAGHAALDEHWRGQFASSAERWALFERALAEYTNYLRNVRR